MNKKVNNYQKWEKEAKERDQEFRKALASNYQSEMKQNQVKHQVEKNLKDSYGLDKTLIEDHGKVTREWKLKEMDRIKRDMTSFKTQKNQEK